MRSRYLAAMLAASLSSHGLQAQEAAEAAGLYTAVDGSGDTTVIFVHGNGNASSADWAGIIPRIARDGLRTVVYDRAGHGRSPIFASPYRLDDEIESLVALVETYDEAGRVILVAHSFGGIVAALAASRSDAIDGVAFVDAPLPGAWTQEMARREVARYRPQFAMLRERAPELAEAIIPRLEAFEDIAARLQSADYPERLLTVAIAAETSMYEDERSIAEERAGLARFVASSDWRHRIEAAQSTHQVMRDRPEVVAAAIDYLIAHAPED